jgi:hypothetical protein
MNGPAMIGAAAVAVSHSVGSAADEGQTFTRAWSAQATTHFTEYQVFACQVNGTELLP